MAKPKPKQLNLGDIVYRLTNRGLTEYRVQAVATYTAEIRIHRRTIKLNRKLYEGDLPRSAPEEYSKNRFYTNLDHKDLRAHSVKIPTSVIRQQLAQLGRELTNSPSPDRLAVIYRALGQLL